MVTTKGATQRAFLDVPLEASGRTNSPKHPFEERERNARLNTLQGRAKGLSRKLGELKRIIRPAEPFADSGLNHLLEPQSKWAPMHLTI